MAHLNIMGVREQVSGECIKSVHGRLDQITSDAPQECEKECGADQRVKLVCVHVPVWSTFLREEEALQQTTHCCHFTDVHLKNKVRHDYSLSGMVSVCS